MMLRVLVIVALCFALKFARGQTCSSAVCADQNQAAGTSGNLLIQRKHAVAIEPPKNPSLTNAQHIPWRAALLEDGVLGTTCSVNEGSSGTCKHTIINMFDAYAGQDLMNGDAVVLWTGWGDISDAPDVNWNQDVAANQLAEHFGSRVVGYTQLGLAIKNALALCENQEPKHETSVSCEWSGVDECPDGGNRTDVCEYPMSDPTCLCNSEWRLISAQITQWALKHGKPVFLMAVGMTAERILRQEPYNTKWYDYRSKIFCSTERPLLDRNTDLSPVHVINTLATFEYCKANGTTVAQCIDRINSDTLAHVRSDSEACQAIPEDAHSCRIQVHGKSGPISQVSISSCHALSLTVEVQSVLRQNGRINDTTPCRECSGDVVVPCCYAVSNAAGDQIQAASVYTKSNKKRPTIELSVSVSLGLEANIDGSMLELLDGLKADDREAILRACQAKGVFKAQALASANVGELVATSGVQGDTLRAVQQRFSSESVTQQAATGATQAVDAALTKASQMRQQAETLRAELDRQTQAAVDSGMRSVSTAAQQQLSDLRARLNTVTLAADDLSVAAAQSTIAQFDESSSRGAVGGTRWSTKQLMIHNGLLRGVELYEDVVHTNLDDVVKLESVASTLGEREIDLKVSLQPDMETVETTIQSTSATSMRSANRVIETLGYSAYKAQQSSFGFGISASGSNGGTSGGGGVGFSFGRARSGGHAIANDGENTEILAGTSKFFEKVRYFFEPRAELRPPRGMLKPANAFADEIRVLDTLDQAQWRPFINTLFQRFGTHTCTHALLGGWWRISAKYESAESRSTMDMAKASTLAIEDAESRSWGFAMSAAVSVNGSDAGVSAGGGSATSQRSASGSGDAARTVNSDAQSNAVMDVKMEWRGGASGGTPAEWRTSLSEGTNSHWKVIDRFADDCSGIWTWVPDVEELSLPVSIEQTICRQWWQSFLESLAVPSDITNDLRGESNHEICRSGNMQVFRLAAIGRASRYREARLLNSSIDCESRPGMFWDSDESTCGMRICTCGNLKGAVGEECPVHHTERCSWSQRESCERLNCGPGLLHVPSAEELKCAGTSCVSHVDETTCCRDSGISNAFDVRVALYRGNFHGTGDVVHVELKDGTHTTGRKAFGKMDSKHDWTQNTVESDGEFKPTEVCLYPSRHDGINVDYVDVKNRFVPDVDNIWVEKVGRASGWGDGHHNNGWIYKGTHQCKMLAS